MSLHLLRPAGDGGLLYAEPTELAAARRNASFYVDVAEVVDFTGTCAARGGDAQYVNTLYRITDGTSLYGRSSQASTLSVDCAACDAALDVAA